MPRLIILLALLSVFFALPGSAVDGGACDSDIAPPAGSICVQLCDGKAAGAGTCAAYGIGREEATLVLEMEDMTNACTDAGGPKFHFRTSPRSDGDGSTAGKEWYDLAGSTVTLDATTNRIVIDMQSAQIDAWLHTEMDAAFDTNCAEVDVRLYRLQKR